METPCVSWLVLLLVKLALLSCPWVFQRWKGGWMTGFTDRAKISSAQLCDGCPSVWTKPASLGHLWPLLQGCDLMGWVVAWAGNSSRLAPGVPACLRQPELSSCDDKSFGFCFLVNRWAFGLTLLPDCPKMSSACWRCASATPAHSILPAASCCHCRATPSFGSDTWRASLAAPGKGSWMWIHLWHCFPWGFALEIKLPQREALMHICRLEHWWSSRAFPQDTEEHRKDKFAKN